MPRATLEAVITALAGGTNGGERPELISVLAGEDPLGFGELEGMTDGDIELELRHGGQPAYWWLITRPSSSRSRAGYDRCHDHDAPMPARALQEPAPQTGVSRSAGGPRAFAYRS